MHRTLHIPIHGILATALAACADASGDGDGSSADSSGPETGSSSSDTTAGPSTTTCGASEDIASTDAQIAELAGCGTYRGSIHLLSDATTVSPLTSLRVIEGEFMVGGTDSPLTTLEGLENLEEVGSFTANTHALADFLPLSSLRQVHGRFTLLGMINLVDLRGLESLETIDEDFRLLANPVLVDLGGLSSLISVGGDFEAESFMTPLPRSEVQALLDRITVGGMVNID